MKNKKEQGSATLLVIGVGMLVITITTFMVMNIGNKKQEQEKEINRITKSYEQNEQELERIYAEALEKNQ